MLKLSVTVGIGIIALAVTFVGYRCCQNRQPASPDILQQANSSPEWEPAAMSLTNENQEVGWVFGRMIGAADAPGSPNYSPFGHSNFRPARGESTR